MVREGESVHVVIVKDFVFFSPWVCVYYSNIRGYIIYRDPMGLSKGGFHSSTIKTRIVETSRSTKSWGNNFPHSLASFHHPRVIVRQIMGDGSKPYWKARYTFQVTPSIWALRPILAD